ncbi:hypothetical protein SDC9_140909 [bioreactor metagenome]|uniref:Uncharacterized protein n=1 Tax=bioreactor metagenome TaxID=1076179 RepID=A0A645DWL5_9ZZZZ
MTGVIFGAIVVEVAVPDVLPPAETVGADEPHHRPGVGKRRRDQQQRLARIQRQLLEDGETFVEIARHQPDFVKPLRRPAGVDEPRFAIGDRGAGG